MSEESLQDRIQRLLNTPTGEKSTDLFQDNVDYSLAKTTFKGNLPGFRKAQGHLYKAQFLNFERAPITNCLIHLYEPHDIDVPVGREFTVILHSHSKEQYCPWKHMCHVRLVSLGKEFPKDFQQYWSKYYESFNSVLEAEQEVPSGGYEDLQSHPSKWAF